MTRFRPGDEVYGDNLRLKGGFAEYTLAPESALAHKPAQLTFVEASTIPQAGAIALQGTKGVVTGRRVLINGAGGGSGSFAIEPFPIFLTDAALVGEAMAEAVGAGAAMAPKRPGPSSAYLGAYKDKAGKWLDGGASYRLRVPPHPPIKLFWSVTVYDADTRALILNEQKVADRSSRMDLQKNEDGSVDIYCGPQAPAGFEKNWIPTVPGKNWFAYFRFYQPTEAYFDRSWPLPDFEQV